MNGTYKKECWLCGYETDCIKNGEGKWECLPCSEGEYFCKCGNETTKHMLTNAGVCEECL